MFSLSSNDYGRVVLLCFKQYKKNNDDGRNREKVSPRRPPVSSTKEYGRPKNRRMTSLPDRHEVSPYRQKRSSSENLGVSPSRLSFSTTFRDVDIPKDKNIKTLTPYEKEWVPDAERTKCFACQSVFGNLFRRKHHCRLCGDIFCNDCAPIRSELGIRACNKCLERRANRLYKSDTLNEKSSKIYRSGTKAYARLCILRFEEIHRMFRPFDVVLVRRS